MNMKHLRQLDKGEGNGPILPSFVWGKIVRMLRIDDMSSFLALLCVEKNSVHYVREALGLFLIDFLEILQDPRQVAILRQTSDHPSLCMAEYVVTWLIRTQSAYKPAIFGRQAFCRTFVRYGAYSLLDKRYQTPSHWSNLLSFIRLCQQVCKGYAFTKEEMVAHSLEMRRRFLIEEEDCLQDREADYITEESLFLGLQNCK
jgi:hypothetical protein